MCGRFLTRSELSWAKYRAFLCSSIGGAPTDAEGHATEVTPLDSHLIVRLGTDGTRELARLVWGLVPSWEPDTSKARKRTIARAETVAQRPSYREAFVHRRCLVPADGFYESKESSGRREHYRFSLADQSVFAFAGIWERWVRPGLTPLETFAIITVDANATVAPVHDRQPVILTASEWDLWLETKDIALAQGLLRACAAEQLVMYEPNKPDPPTLFDWAAIKENRRAARRRAGSKDE